MIVSLSLAAHSDRSPSTSNPQTKTSNYWNSIDLFHHNSTLSHHLNSILSKISSLGIQEHQQTLPSCTQPQVFPIVIGINHILQIFIWMASSPSNNFQVELCKPMLNFTQYLSPLHQYQSSMYSPFHELLSSKPLHSFSTGECSYNIYFFPVISFDEWLQNIHWCLKFVFHRTPLNLSRWFWPPLF